MPSNEHVQTKELAQVNMEKEKLVKELTNRRDKVLALEKNGGQIAEEVRHSCMCDSSA